MKNITRILLVVTMTGSAVSRAQTTPTNSESSGRTTVAATAGVAQAVPASSPSNSPAGPVTPGLEFIPTNWIVTYWIVPTRSNSPAGPVMPGLSAGERTAIIAAANETVRKFVHMDPQSRRNGEIPEKIWGAALSRLKPMRVVDDSMNVMIVLKDDNDTEEGFYVVNPVSSHLPQADKRFTLFERLSQPEDHSFGSICHYQIRKSKSSP